MNRTFQPCICESKEHLVVCVWILSVQIKTEFGHATPHCLLLEKLHYFENSWTTFNLLKNEGKHGYFFSVISAQHWLGNKLIAYSNTTHTNPWFSSLPVESLVKAVSCIIGADLFQVDTVTQLWENTVVRTKKKSGVQLSEAIWGRQDLSSLILPSRREPHAAHAKDYSFPASPHFSPFISLAHLDSQRGAEPLGCMES